MAIPLPGMNGDMFLKGVNTGSNMLSRIMQPILSREQMANQKYIHEAQLAQQKKIQEAQLAQQLRTHLDNLSLSKQTQNRLGQLLPHQIQQLQDAHRKSQPGYGLEQYKLLEDYVKGQRKPKNIEQEGLPIQEMGQGMGLFAPEGMNEAQQQAQQQTTSNNNNGIDLELLKQHPLLQSAAKKYLGYNAAASIPQTSEEKDKSAINRAITIDEAKANRKKIDEIEKTSRDLLPYISKVNTIEDILKRKPELVGRTTQLADALGMTKDEDVGKFLSAAQSLQTHLTKLAGSQGGARLFKMVEQAKPNIGKSSAYNIGVTKELKESMRNAFDEMKEEYERLGNKKFPYNFEQYFDEQKKEINNEQGAMVAMISPSGKRVMIPSDKVNAALSAGGKHA